MKKQAGFLRENLQQVFAAFAYQYSGEMLSSSRKSLVLADDLTSAIIKDNQPDSGNNISSLNRILVALDTDIEGELIKYSIGAARNFNAKIDILTSSSKDEVNRIMSKELKKQTVPWSYIKLETDILAGIVDYTSSHSNIVFIVTSQHHVLAEHYIKTKHAA